MRATPIRIKRRRDEDAIQADIIGLLKVAAIPRLIYFAVPNGGKRDIATARALKDTGVVPGVADLVLINPKTSVAHFLEVKTDKGSLSKEQRKFRDICKANDVPWRVVRSRDQAQDVLTDWKMLRIVKQA